MNRMTFKYYRALKATLDMLANKCNKGILMYGTNTIEQKTFCKLIDLRKASFIYKETTFQPSPTRIRQANMKNRNLSQRNIPHDGDNPFTWQHFKYCLLLIIIYILIYKIIQLWQ